MSLLDLSSFFRVAAGLVPPLAPVLAKGEAFLAAHPDGVMVTACMAGLWLFANEDAFRVLLLRGQARAVRTLRRWFYL